MDSKSGEQTTFSKRTLSTSYEQSLESNKPHTAHHLTLAPVVQQGTITEPRSNFPMVNPDVIERPLFHPSAFHPVHHLPPGFLHFSPAHGIFPPRPLASPYLTGSPHSNVPAYGPLPPVLYGNGVPFLHSLPPYMHKLVNPAVAVANRNTPREHFASDDGPKKCPVCGKSYARMSTLRLHLRTHRGEKPYQCLVCLKSFSQAANLTAHFRIHSGEKPFKCHICNRQFSQSSSVTTHKRTHNGERPYRCHICTKAFVDSSTLTKHMRTHTEEKPYQCDICFQQFSQSGNP